MQLATKLLLLAGMTAAAAYPDAIYFSNTTNDQQFSVFFSTGFTRIGDEVLLTTSGGLDSLDAQFYNAGSDASFDAVVTFYQSDSPLFTQIGGSYVVSNISIAGGTSETVTFPNLGGLLVPQDLIVAFAVQNVSAGGDIGVNFFDPPTIGSSDPTYFIADSGSGLAQVSTNLDIDNIYLEVDGVTTAAPEPSSAALLAVALASFGYWKRAQNRASQRSPSATASVK